jgi:hypothetical protein
MNFWKYFKYVGIGLVVVLSILLAMHTTSVNKAKQQEAPTSSVFRR